MPRRLYLLRHGQTDANVSHIIQGQSANLPLNNAGLKQAELTAEALSRANFSYIYTSPALRARQTAKKIFESHLPLVLAETNINLAEINFGILEGKTFTEAEKSYPALLKVYREKPSRCVFPDGESMAEAYERIGRAINIILALTNRIRNENILIVSHGGTISLIFIYLLNLDIDKMFHAVRHHNCGLSIIDLEISIWGAPQRKPQITCLNDIGHLKEEQVKRLNNPL